MQSQSDDGTYLTKSKWSLTLAEGNTAQTWLVDTEAGAIQVRTADGEGGIRVEEWVSNIKYTYMVPDMDTDMDEMDVDAFCAEVGDVPEGTDCATLAAETAADTAVIRQELSSHTGSCSSEDVPVGIDHAILAENGNIMVGGFRVKMVDGVPAAILDGETGEVVATVNSIEEVEGDLDISGCSEDAAPDAERRLAVFEAIGESRRRRRTAEGENGAKVEAARQHLSGMYMSMLVDSEPEEIDQAERHLGAATDFQAWASGTQWCGAGTDLDNTPCPWTQDDDGDMACHRHDHGKKANGIIGGMAVRLGCDIDRGLADRTNNWAVQAVFGSRGIAKVWGCYDEGLYECWYWEDGGWWPDYLWYGNHCRGEHTHYGKKRYKSYSHSYGWNDQSRCTTDLPWDGI
jgi:hypothetical protein